MNRLVTGAAALALLATAAPAFAAPDTAQDSSTVTARIIRPISVTKNNDLAFGTIVKPSTGSNTVDVSTAGVRSITGGGDAVALGSTSAGNAQFTVGGEGAQSITVTVPASFNLTGPSTIAVTTSNDLTGAANAQTLSGSLGGAGTLVVKVGGSFTVATSTATGDYTGTLTVSANYN